MSRLGLVCAVALLHGSTLYAAEVCNAGYPGANSEQLLQQLPQALASCPNAGVVVLFVGMNDAANPARFLAPGQTQQSVARMLQSIREANAKAVLVTVHVPDSVRLLQRHKAAEYAGIWPDQRVAATDAALLQAAHNESAVIVDFRTILAKAGGADAELSTDGVHLTPRGYHLLAASVAAALPPRVGKVLCLGDSLTFGIGVRAPGLPDHGSASYPQQLLAILNGAL